MPEANFDRGDWDVESLRASIFHPPGPDAVAKSGLWEKATGNQPESIDTPEAEFDAEYQEVIDELRNGNREVLAEELIEMLRNSLEDPDEVEIKLLSLQAMARFLIRQREFDDPVTGPDPSGIMQVEWHILGNGLLVMAFLEDDQLHCVVQTDATSERGVLNENALLTESEALERFGYLVPRR